MLRELSQVRVFWTFTLEMSKIIWVKSRLFHSTQIQSTLKSRILWLIETIKQLCSSHF